MIIRDVNLETVCGVTSKLPDNTLPEFAFAGKSNVGKSSLINALMNRKAYARTSSQPGKTQTINFYNINKELYYVDLPGYGYAKVSVEAKAKWGKMIERYLRNSDMLKMVFLLIDIRHEPSANDKMMYDWIIYNGYHPVIIATKLDKINRSQIQKNVKIVRQGLGMEKDGIIIPFSAETKQGREEIWKLIEDTLADVSENHGCSDRREYRRVIKPFRCLKVFSRHMEIKKHRLQKFPAICAFLSNENLLMEFMITMCA